MDPIDLLTDEITEAEMELAAIYDGLIPNVPYETRKLEERLERLRTQLRVLEQSDA